MGKYPDHWQWLGQTSSRGATTSNDSQARMGKIGNDGGGRSRDGWKVEETKDEVERFGGLPPPL